MPKKKQPELTSEEQKKRFEELSREVGANASNKELHDLVRRISQQKSKGQKDAKS